MLGRAKRSQAPKPAASRLPARIAILRV